MHWNGTKQCTRCCGLAPPVSQGMPPQLYNGKGLTNSCTVLIPPPSASPPARIGRPAILESLAHSIGSLPYPCLRPAPPPPGPAHPCLSPTVKTRCECSSRRGRGRRYPPAPSPSLTLASSWPRARTTLTASTPTARSSKSSSSGGRPESPPNGRTERACARVIIYNI